jgi:L-malate glycosyltransferase
MKQLKYLFIGNAESVHLLKWIKEISKYTEVYVLSTKGLHFDLKDIIPNDHCFLLNLNIKSEGGNIGVLKSVFKIRKIISEISPDIVNAHFITSHGLLVAIVKKIFFYKFVFVASAWGTDIMVTPKKSKLHLWITQFILNSSDLITSDAIVMSDEIKKLTSKTVLTFTFGLPKLPDYKPDEKDSNLYFSNRILSENYNINRIIRLFKYILEKNKNAKLIIGNEGNMKEELHGLSHSLGLDNNVVFIGFMSLEAQEDYYRKASVYFSLPTSDATSVSLLEAMAWGCIPILSDIPANKEWVENGVNGLILKENDLMIDLDILNKQKDIALKNRQIISEKAIFPVSVQYYFEKIKKLCYENKI